MVITLLHCNRQSFQSCPVAIIVSQRFMEVEYAEGHGLQGCFGVPKIQTPHRQGGRLINQASANVL